MKNALTEEIIRDSADISEKEKPITKLSFIRISNQKFIDLSILLKLQNLRIISLTFCSISSFPKEFFKIPTLESIDLKGNNITKLTDENWELLPNLKILNLSDNEISQIAYINSLSKIPMLRQLNLTGNPIMTDSNSFDQVVEQLPKLDVLNDFIILSQHRGLTQKIAFPNNIALLPYTQIDDYYFLFLRYMRNNTIEYNVRQMHVGFLV